VTAGYILTFGSESSSAIPEVIVTKVERRLLGGARDVWTEVPGREGAWLFAEKRGMREVTCSVAVVGASTGDRRDAVEEVADWLDTTDQRRLIVSDRPDRYWWAKLAAPPDVDEWRQMAGTERGFPVSFLALPYAFSTTLSTHSFSVTAASGVDTWTPADTVDAYPVVEITAVGGTVVGFTLDVNGDTLTYTGTVTTGNTVTASSVAYVLTTGVNTDTELTGALDYGAVTMADVSGVFGRIVVGANTVTFTKTAGTATSVTVALTWRRRYR